MIVIARRILSIDADDGPHLESVAALANDATRVDLVGSAAAALADIEAEPPDVVLLDPMLPDIDGFELCRRLSAWPAAPIIGLTGDAHEHAQLALFAAGADDVIVKPVSTALLRARIDVQLRHVTIGARPADELIQLGDLRLDTGAREARVGGRKLDITAHQFTILRVLVHHAGKVVTPSVIARAVGHGGDERDANSVRIAIHRLRKRIGQGPRTPLIVTERSSGYRLTLPEWPA